jgi:Na+/phosphate symporter
MNIINILASIAFIAMGVLAVVASKSDIQIILAVLCFGFGFMLFALNAIMNAVRNVVAVDK